MFINTKVARRKLLFPCILCVFGVTYYLYFYQQPQDSIDDLLYRNTRNNLTCHYVYSDDALPLYDARVFKPPKKSIFFHDTSCKGTLNSRQLCAIESAARAHPNREIYVFFSGPVSELEVLSDLAVLDDFSNVHVARIHITNYAADSPVEHLILNGILNKTKWGIENTSNVLRFLTLYRWSGVYLDTDVVVVKSFDSLPANWIAREDKRMLNAAALSLSDDEVGRYFATLFLEEIVMNYSPDIWTHNGPGAVTRVLTRECNVKDPVLMTPDSCKGFTVLSPKFFYPIHYSVRDRYFIPGYTKKTSEAYVHHLWNRLTHHLSVPKNSFYYNLAKEYCPSVHNLYGDKFGM
ncbi:unnamed protein product [Colias eurytheme]|nr:unnamed protein product [Colias eurytheme]